MDVTGSAGSVGDRQSEHDGRGSPRDEGASMRCETPSEHQVPPATGQPHVISVGIFHYSHPCRILLCPRTHHHTNRRC